MKLLLALALCQLTQAQFISVAGNGQPGYTSTAATPTFSPIAGTYGSTQSVTISTSTGGATLCYNTTGSPTGSAGTCTGGATTYSTPVSVSSSETLYAIATKSGLTNSSVGSAAYVIGGGGLGATTNNVNYSDSGGVAQPTFSMPSTPSASSTILLTIFSGTLTVSGCTDNQSPANTYGILVSKTINTSDNIYLISAYIATSSGTFTVTCTQSSTFAAANIVAGEYTGFPSGGVTVDGSSANFAAFTGSCLPGSFTTSNAANLIYGGTLYSGSTVPTANSSYAIPSGSYTASNGMTAEYQVVSATGSYNPGWTLASANLGCLGAGLH